MKKAFEQKQIPPKAPIQKKSDSTSLSATFPLESGNDAGIIQGKWAEMVIESPRLDRFKEVKQLVAQNHQTPSQQDGPVVQRMPLDTYEKTLSQQLKGAEKIKEFREWFEREFTIEHNMGAYDSTKLGHDRKGNTIYKKMYQSLNEYIVDPAFTLEMLFGYIKDFQARTGYGDDGNYYKFLRVEDEPGYLHQLTSSRFLRSINDLGLQSSFTRTGKMEPQEGGATANTLEMHIAKETPGRLKGYIRELIKLGYSTEQILGNGGAELPLLAKHKLEGNEDDHLALGKEEEANKKTYINSFTAAPGPSSSLKAGELIKMANAIEGKMEDGHYLRKMAASSARRQKMVEAYITSQHIYGVPHDNLKDTVNQYKGMIADPVLLRWRSSQGDWEQDQAEFKALRSKKGIDPEDLQIMFQGDFNNETDRNNERNWKSLQEHLEGKK